MLVDTTSALSLLTQKLIFTRAGSVQPIVLCVGNIARQILSRNTSFDSKIIHARVVAVYFKVIHAALNV